ncbi:MAG: hemerythrin domain-containing protein [Dehalococcoidia bacterium]|nr:hemerythrin domain-containing protein [Dehalococcoidia bacterium]
MATKTNWKALDILGSAHIGGLSKLAEMEAAIKQLRSGDTLTAASRLRGLLTFFDGDLKTHFDHEEKALFPVLSRIIGPMGPVQVMLDEHKVLWQAIEELKLALPDCERGEANAAEKVDRIASHILWTLRSHIQKEDEMLFPMADTQLNTADKEIVTLAIEAGCSAKERTPLIPTV